MPRCLMAKKWKAYPWPDRVEEPTIEVEEDEEIDVVGDSPAALAASGKVTSVTATCWGPSSPTAGATAPSPPPHSPEATRGSTMLYNGYGHDVSPSMHFTAYHPRTADNEVTVITSPSNVQQTSYATIQIQPNHDRYSSTSPSPAAQTTVIVKQEATSTIQRKSLAMCFTSTGAALSLPPKKKDIYRPYSLDDRPMLSNSPTPPPQSPQRTYEMRIPAEEDLHAAHAILDLSASTAFLPPPQMHQLTQQHQIQLQSPPPSSHNLTIIQNHHQIHPHIDFHDQRSMDYSNDDDDEDNHLRSMSSPDHHYNVQNENNNSMNHLEHHTKIVNGKTVAYTYEAFFVSDGRSKKKITEVAVPDPKSKYTCTECGKQYATSSNLSRHKQTHRSLDSQSAKKCMTCGKAYVSMPALAMHVLTHKLAHSCGVCGKLFSRPWLLQGHLRSHTGEKPYGCAHCGKAFADRSNLRAHMQTHSADKNFECQRCHKTFALKSYLNKHLESACFKDEGHVIMGEMHSPSSCGNMSDSEDYIISTPTKSNNIIMSSNIINNSSSNNIISNNNHSNQLIEITNSYGG